MSPAQQATAGLAEDDAPAAETARLPVIDADGHVTELPHIWEEYVEPRFRARAPRVGLDEQGHPCQFVDDRIVMRHAMLLTLGPDYSFDNIRGVEGGSDGAARLRELDSEGIDVAVLFPSVALYVAEATDPELQAALCRGYNDWLAVFCRPDPSRLIGVALLPLVDVEASVRELERTTEKYGFRGIFFRPNPYADRPIHDPAYEPLWQAAESLGVAVAVHEGLSDTLPTMGRERLENPAVLHVVCHPFEQMPLPQGSS